MTLINGRKIFHRVLFGNTFSVLEADDSAASFHPVGYRPMILISTVLHFFSAAWIQVASPTGTTLRSVSWTGSSYVAVGDSGVILSSPTGRNWTTESSGTTHSLRVVRGNDTLRIAAGESGTVVVDRNRGGWTASPTGDTLAIQALAIGPVRTVLSHGGSSALWSGSPVGPWRRDTLVIQGEDMVSPPRITGRITGYRIRALDWDGRRFVGVGNTNAVFYTLPDDSWTARAVGSTGLAAMAQDQGVLFATTSASGKDGTGIAQTSELIAGTYWSQTILGSISANPRLRLYTGIDARNGRRLAVGDSGVIVSWLGSTGLSGDSTPTRRTLRSAAIGDSTTVAVGDSGTILVRHDDSLATGVRDRSIGPRISEVGQIMSDGRAAFLRAPQAGEWIATLFETDGRILWSGHVRATSAGEEVRIESLTGKTGVLRYEWRKITRGNGSM